MKLSLLLNGEPVTCEVAGDALLLDVVRDLGLTGSKEGCGVGVCGACSMLVDDEPVSGCLFFAGCADGASVWTIEGIAERDRAVIDAFVTCEGMQCGICTPGQVVAAAALGRSGVPLRADAGAEARADAVREYMAGNLCRCTGYDTIVEAVMRYLG